ncbi:unnamed protein product [Phyllotreta striolata]|uniref:Uncharacterized protein n=1 Tax=Phyllotreta striolata TaxID=444603 RepID=A0A9N9XSH8_PHYSR|nr:unnamed protein product [Phyllotreta striolata]
MEEEDLASTNGNFDTLRQKFEEMSKQQCKRNSRMQKSWHSTTLELSHCNSEVFTDVIVTRQFSNFSKSKLRPVSYSDLTNEKSFNIIKSESTRGSFKRRVPKRLAVGDSKEDPAYYSSYVDLRADKNTNNTLKLNINNLISENSTVGDDLQNVANKKIVQNIVNKLNSLNREASQMRVRKLTSAFENMSSK